MKKLSLLFLMLGLAVGANAQSKEAIKITNAVEELNGTCYTNGERGTFKPTSRTTYSSSSRSQTNTNTSGSWNIGASAKASSKGSGEVGVSGGYSSGNRTQTTNTGGETRTQTEYECVPNRVLYPNRGW